MTSTNPAPEQGEIPAVNTLSPQAGHIVASSYADSIGLVFLLMVPLIAISLMFISMIKEVPLRSKVDGDDELEELADIAAAPITLQDGPEREREIEEEEEEEEALQGAGPRRLRRRSRAGARAGV